MTRPEPETFRCFLNPDRGLASVWVDEAFVSISDGKDAVTLDFYVWVGRSDLDIAADLYRDRLDQIAKLREALSVVESNLTMQYLYDYAKVERELKGE